MYQNYLHWSHTTDSVLLLHVVATAESACGVEL